MDGIRTDKIKYVQNMCVARKQARTKEMNVCALLANHKCHTYRKRLCTIALNVCVQNRIIRSLKASITEHMEWLYLNNEKEIFQFAAFESLISVFVCSRENYFLGVSMLLFSFRFFFLSTATSKRTKLMFAHWSGSFSLRIELFHTHKNSKCKC